MKIITINEVKDYSFGGKAHGLSLLIHRGLRVPKGLCIESVESSDLYDDKTFRDGLRFMLEELTIDEPYHVAVRSSSLIEDSLSESKAGHFLTKIGTYTLDELILVLKDVHASGEKMSIIIQEAIDADVSGVFFSSDPNTYSKKKGILSYTNGMGESLVSGSDYSEDISVDFDIELENPQFRSIANDIKKLERELGYPIDVEWCIKDGVVHYMQCRPIASITSIRSGFYHIGDDFPPLVMSHDKIGIRKEAMRTNTFISDAYIHVENTSNKHDAVECQNIGFLASRYCKGYSVVIIYPRRISEKVVRSFVGKDEDISRGIGRCYRYGIRSYPEYKDLPVCLKVFHEKTCADYWISAVIVQEIFDAAYTGILQKTDGGYLIEITKGHFLTKGGVPTSQYHVVDGDIKERNEIYQNKWYRIIQGHVIECICNDEGNSFVSLKDEQVKNVIRAFQDIIADGGRVVEFGMVRDGNNLLPYLIDFVDSEDVIQGDDISEGIISRGRKCGRIKHIEVTGDALNTHYHDAIKSEMVRMEDMIFVCDTPDISLLKIVGEYEASKIGFAFRDGSVLCHLSVVLREKGIPAIKIGDIKCVEGENYILDAETPKLSGKERLIRE